MVAVIVAGGKGTRLGLTTIPKCMVKLNGIPLIEHQIRTLKENGILEFYILTGHLSEIIKKHLKDGKKLDVKIHYITETEPLGTAGSIRQLYGIIKTRFLVVYGDIIFDMDIKRLLRFDRKTHGIMTIVAHPNDHPHDSDLIEIYEDNEIKKLHPKPHTENQYYKNLVNSGIYIFSPFVLEPLHKTATKFLDIGKNILPHLIRKCQVYAYTTPEYIKDIGTQTRLAQARADIISGKISRMNLKNKQKAIFLDRDGVINKFIPNIYQLSEFELIPGVVEAIHQINKSEYLAVVVTNQPAIAKGWMTEADLQNMHDKMDTLLGRHGAYIDALYYCPHHPHKGFPGEVPQLKINCKCRKPKPGMLIQAAQDLNIDLKNSWVIGDSYRDIMAGVKVGCRTISIGAITPGSKHVTKNLTDAVKFIGNQP